MASGNEGGKRSPRGSAASFIHRLLRWLNYTVLAASLIAIICMLALRLFPTAWGWGFLSFSFLSMASAMVGCISTTPTGRGMCYSLHMLLLITSTSIQGAVFLLFLTRPDAVLDHLQSNRSEYDGRVLLKVDAALLLWVFCIQLIILAMACMVHYCEPTEYYEDLEGNKTAIRRCRGSRNLSRVQEESFADADGQAQHQGKNENESEASRLQEAMKEEKFSEKKSKQVTFDNVEI